MEAVVLTLLGLLLPTQLGFHLWPTWSYVYGLRIDYLSPTLYLTDILLVVILFLNFKKIKWTSLVVGGVFVFLNIAFSVSPQVATIAWFRLFLLFNLVSWLMVQPFNRLTYLFLGLATSTIITTILALAEFAGQSSIDSFFYWLGERHFDLTTPGIARLNFFGHNLLRPYATFGHPNALGGFALVVMFLLGSRIINLKSYLLLRLALPFALLSVALSFSKAALFTCLLIIVYKSLRLRPKLILLLSLLLALIATLAPIFFTSLSFGRSLIDRNYLIIEAFQIIRHSPLFGVGLGNFVSAQGQFGLGLQGAFIYLQPVHNLFLLLFSEIGIVGLVLAFALMSRIPTTSPYLLATILLTGSLDHYWLTLQQPRLLLAIVVGLILNKKISSILTTSH